MNDLKNRAVKGVKWTGINSAVNVVLSPIVLTVLARLLTPDEYGLIAIVTMIMGFSKQIAMMGFSQAIIQRDEINDGDLSSVFWFEQILGIIAFIIIYFASPLIVSFFDAPNAVSLIRVSAFVFLFEPIDLVFRALLKRELVFNVLTKATLVRTVFTQLTKILFAFLGFGAMSVVLGNLIGIFILTIILTVYFYRKQLWLPKLYFSYSKLKPYLSFGVFIAGKSIFNNLFNYADEIIIGGSLGTEVLGIYHFAKQILNYLMGLLNKPISEVGYPLLSKVNDNLERFNRNYIRLIKYIGTLSIPAYIGIAVTAPLFVPIFFGEVWLDAIPIVILLSGWGMFKSMYSGIISSALYSFGNSDWILYATMIDLPIRVLILYIASQFSIEIVALSLSMIAIIKFIIYQNILKLVSEIRVLDIFKSLKMIFIASIIMIAVLQIPFEVILDVSQIIYLIVNILVGALTYGLFMLLFERQYLISTIKMMKIW